MAQRAASVDMTKGSPLRVVVSFGLPILLGSTFQQFYSTVDSIVVGNYVGADALAAVGTSMPLIMLLSSFCMGLFTGASIIVAQLTGAGRGSDIKSTVSTSLIFAILLSVVFTLVGVFAAGALLRMIHTPESILPDATTYMQIFFGGALFVFLYNYFAAVLRALGDSRTPLYFLILSSVLNIGLDLLFVVSFGMGVAGVAWATLLSQAVSAVLCYVYVSKKVPAFQFGRGEFVFSRHYFREILRLGIPSAVQSSLMSVGFLFMQNLVNSFGATNIAAYTAANKMEGICNLPAQGFSQALAFFVGQNMGAGNVERAKKGLMQTIALEIVVCSAMAAVIWTYGSNIIGLFVNAGETVVIERGAAYLRAFALLIVFHALMNCFGAVLRGAGDATFSLAVSIADLGMRVASAYAMCAHPAIGFMGVAYSIPVGWVCSTLIGALRYWQGGWKSKVVRAEGT